MTFCPLKNVCRLCGNKAKLLIGVFDPDGEAITLERKIRMCLPITVSIEDNMPKQVCHGCLQKLETSYELYLTCNSAQTTIKRLLKLQDSIGNSSSTPKTCFIEQCEREKEKNSGNGVTRDVRSLDIQVTPSLPGQSFPNRTCIIEPGSACNRVPMSNGFSMSTSVVNGPQTQTTGQPVLPHNVVTSNGTVGLNDYSPIGQIRTAPPLQMLSMQLQPVGQIKSIGPGPGPFNPLQQGPQITQVFGAIGSQPSTNHLPAEPIDSKENLRLSLQAKSLAVTAPTPTLTSVATHTPIVTQTHTPAVTQSHPPTVTQAQAHTPTVTQAQAHMPTVTQTQKHVPPVIHTKSASPKGVRRASSGLKVRRSTETINTNNNVAKSTTNNRASNNVMQNGAATTVAQSVVSVCNPQAAEDSSAEAATAVAAILDVNDDDHFEPLVDDTCDSTDDIELMTVAKRPRTKSTDVEVACKYCGKMFSEDVIMLHQNLHLRVKFFSCMDCDKNFTTVQGLDKHKCESRPDS